MTFRDPRAAQAGGYVLALAGLLVATGLLFHPVPSGGFEERPSVLATMGHRKRIPCCTMPSISFSTGTDGWGTRCFSPG
jgi:hypothetical protein